MKPLRFGNDHDDSRESEECEERVFRRTEAQGGPREQRRNKNERQHTHSPPNEGGNRGYAYGPSSLAAL